MGALVFGFGHEGSDPPVIVRHPTQASQVKQRRRHHRRHCGDSLKDYHAISIASSEQLRRDPYHRRDGTEREAVG
jgi:hypothetical protein